MVLDPPELEAWLDAGEVYSTDDVSTPPAVDEETGLKVCEELPTLNEAELVEDVWEDCAELLPDPDVLCPSEGEVYTGDELTVGVVAGPVTTQEQADEIWDGELLH
jgi:hypothetical protein